MGEAPRELVRYTGKPAATLIGILTILIIFYIIFLPPQTREALLGDKNITETINMIQETTLLKEPIGKLTYLAENDITHHIPGAYLEKKEEVKTLAQFDSFTISKSIFGSESNKKIFTIPELNKVSDAIMTFQAPERSGKLKITLNGQELMNEEITTPLPKPIKLPKEYLKKTNELVFEVSEGIFKKEYKIEDLTITERISQEEESQAEHHFTIPGAEIDNFKNAYIEFRTSCKQKETGKLNIELNGRTMSSTIPACDSTNKIEVFKEDLLPGKNTIKFTLEKGRARIENAKIKVNLKEQKGYTNFFTIENKLWEQIKDNKKKVIMDIEFIDDGLRKRLEANVNGRRTIIDQKEPHYTRDITTSIREGNNYVQLTPMTEVMIVEMEVRVEEK